MKDGKSKEIWKIEAQKTEDKKTKYAGRSHADAEWTERRKVDGKTRIIHRRI